MKAKSTNGLGLVYKGGAAGKLESLRSAAISVLKLSRCFHCSKARESDFQVFPEMRVINARTLNLFVLIFQIFHHDSVLSVHIQILTQPPAHGFTAP